MARKTVSASTLTTQRVASGETVLDLASGPLATVSRLAELRIDWLLAHGAEIQHYHVFEPRHGEPARAIVLSCTERGAK